MVIVASRFTLHPLNSSKLTPLQITKRLGSGPRPWTLVVGVSNQRKCFFFFFQALLLIGRWMEETANYEPNRVIQQYKVAYTVSEIH